MDKIFPSMQSKPEKFQIFVLIGYAIMAFVLFPMYMPILGLGIWEHEEFGVWLEIVYHVVNGVAMLFLMSSYLKEEWFMVTTDVRYYLKHIALTVGLILGAELVLLGTLALCGLDITDMVECLPVVEMFVSHTPLYVIAHQPIFGTIVLSVFAPMSICALFYCLGFAPACYKETYLGYLSLILVTMIPPIIDIVWRGDTALVLSGHLVQLPVHLLACWSYQKTDNVWTPLISLALSNLLLSIGLQFLWLR